MVSIQLPKREKSAEWWLLFAKARKFQAVQHRLITRYYYYLLPKAPK